MSDTSSREFLNSYTLIPVAGQPGAYTVGSTDSGLTNVVDTPDGPGDNTSVLGDVGNDQFTANGASETYSGYGVGLFPNGDVAVEGPIGMNSNGTYTLYSESTIAPGTVVQLQPDQPGGGAGAQNQFSLDTAAPVPCFAAGTAISTPMGAVPVESLKAGDLVLTADGAVRPVRWLGRQTVSMRFGDPLRVTPVRVKAGALDENVPSRDLVLSPDHALLVDGVLIHAGALVNASSVVRELDVPETFIYYHVELTDHSLVLAEGAPAETFIDNIDRLSFDNWDEHEAIGTDLPGIVEMSYPRAKSQRQVASATRQRLAARAQALFGADIAAAA